MATIVENLLELVDLFGGVASSNPVSAVLLLVGFVLVAVSSLVLGYLAAGATVDFLIPESLGRRPPRRG